MTRRDNPGKVLTRTGVGFEPLTLGIGRGVGEERKGLARGGVK